MTKNYILPDIIVEHVIGKNKTKQIIGPNADLEEREKLITRILWDDTISIIQKKIFVASEVTPPEWQSLFIYDPVTGKKIYLNDNEVKESGKKYLFQFTFNGKIKDNTIYFEALDDHIDNLERNDQECLKKNCKSRSAGKLNDIIEIRHRWGDIKMDQIRSLVLYILDGIVDDYIFQSIDPEEKTEEGAERLLDADYELSIIATQLKNYPRNSPSDPEIKDLFEFSPEGEAFRILRAIITVNADNPKTQIDLPTIFNRIELDDKIPFVATNFSTDGMKSPQFKLWNGLQNIMDSNLQKEVSEWIIKDGVELRSIQQIIFRVQDTNSDKLKYIRVIINQSGVVTLICSWSGEERANEKSIMNCLKLANKLISKVNEINEFSDLENLHNIPEANVNNSNITTIDGQINVLTILNNDKIFRMIGDDTNPLSYFSFRTSRTKESITYRHGNTSILIRGGSVTSPNSNTIKIDSVKNIQNLNIIHDFIISLTKLYIKKYGREKIKEITEQKKNKKQHVITRLCQPRSRLPTIDNDYKYNLAKDSYDIFWPLASEKSNRYVCPNWSEEQIKSSKWGAQSIERWNNTPFIFPGFQRDKSGKIGICCFGTLSETGTKGSPIWNAAMGIDDDNIKIKKSIASRTITSSKHVTLDRTGFLLGNHINNYLLIIFQDLIKEIEKIEKEKIDKGKKKNNVEVRLLRFGAGGSFFDAVYAAIRYKHKTRKEITNNNDVLENNVDVRDLSNKDKQESKEIIEKTIDFISSLHSGDDLRRKIVSNLDFNRFKSLENGNFLSSGTETHNKLDLLEKKITDPIERANEEKKSFNKYIKLLKTDMFLEHNFIWDLTTRFIRHNIYIFDEETDTMLCPGGDDIFNKNFPSIILLKKSGFPTYEPIFLMNDKSKTIPKRSYFRYFSPESKISKELFNTLEFICRQDREIDHDTPEMMTAYQLKKYTDKKLGAMEFTSQIINSYNKAIFLVHKTGVLVPVKQSGPLEDLPVSLDITKHKRTATETKELLNKLASNLELSHLLGVASQIKIEQESNEQEKFVAILTKSALPVPIKKSTDGIDLPITRINFFNGLDPAIFEGNSDIGVRIITVRKRLYKEEILQRLRLEMSYYLNETEHKVVKNSIIDILKLGTTREEKVKSIQPIISKIAYAIFKGVEDPFNGMQEIPRKRKVCQKMVIDDICNTDPFCKWNEGNKDNEFDKVNKTPKCQLIISNKFIDDAVTYIIDDIIRDRKGDLLNNRISKEISESGKPIIRPSETIITNFDQAIEWIKSMQNKSLKNDNSISNMNIYQKQKTISVIQ